MKQEKLKKEAQNLSLLPGVYFMRDALDNIIYIGKSKALKRRVGSYFSNSKKPEKVMRMVRHIDHFEATYTDTELDALILECRLIKQYRPIYNRLLKQDHKYRYLYLDEQAIRPRIKLVREQTHQGYYFGPYEKGQWLYDAMTVLNAFYQLPDCKAQEIKMNCLTYKRGKCLGPCQPPYDDLAFKKQLAGVIRFLEGEETAPISYYEQKMAEAAMVLDFESALQYKETWFALKALHYKKEAMCFAMSSQITLLKQPCPSGGEKLWLFKGTKIMWESVFKEQPSREGLTALLEEVMALYEQEKDHLVGSLSKEEVDEVQIIYSYMKKQPEAWIRQFEVSGHLKKDQSVLKYFLRELINDMEIN